jgi:GTPase
MITRIESTNTTNTGVTAGPSLCQALAKMIYDPIAKGKIPYANPLPPEVEQGNHEYKYTLANISPQQLTHRISQLLWRLKESQTQQNQSEFVSEEYQSPRQDQQQNSMIACETAYYHIGVEDNGNPLGISDRDLKSSLQTLEMMAKETNCEVFLKDVNKGVMIGGYIATIVFTRKACVSIDTTTNVTIALAGQEGSGKSTMIGVLSSHQRDNGRGLARMKVLTHNHEVMTGHTSSISHTILYDNHVTAENTAAVKNKEQMKNKKKKMVSLIDLAGHSKYLKTTVTGLVGRKPDYIAVTVSCVQGIQEMTKEHIAIALYLQVPLIVIVTKIDLLPIGSMNTTTACRRQCQEESLKSLFNQLEEIIAGSSTDIKKRNKACNKQQQSVIQTVRTKDDLIPVTCMTADQFSTNNSVFITNTDVDGQEKSQLTPGVIPLFLVSNVTGEGLDLVRQFFFMLSPVPMCAMNSSNARSLSPDAVSLRSSTHACAVTEAEDDEASSCCVDDPEEMNELNQIRIFGAIGRGDEATTEEEEEEDDEEDAIDDLDEDLMLSDGNDEDEIPPERLTPAFNAIITTAAAAKKRRRQDKALFSSAAANVCPPEFADLVAATNSSTNPKQQATNTTKILIGKVMNGQLQIGSQFCFGPTCQGDFITVSVTSLRVNNTPVQVASLGQIATFCLAFVSRKHVFIPTGLTSTVITKANKLKNISGFIHDAVSSQRIRLKRRHLAGLVLLSTPTSIQSTNDDGFCPKASWEFLGEILVINRTSPMRVNYEPVLHSGNIRQAVRVVEIVGGKMEVNNQERALCRFRFVHYPEYLTVGDAFIIREDRTRGVGIISKLI